MLAQLRLGPNSKKDPTKVASLCCKRKCADEIFRAALAQASRCLLLVPKSPSGQRPCLAEPFKRGASHIESPQSNLKLRYRSLWTWNFTQFTQQVSQKAERKQTLAPYEIENDFHH